MCDEATAFPVKGSWNNEELRVVEAAYEAALREEAFEGGVSDLDKERLARKIMALARQGRIGASGPASTWTGERRGTDALLPPLARMPLARQIQVEGFMDKRIAFQGAFAPTALRALTPGSPYIGVRCRNCELHVGLFDDIAEGEPMTFAGDASFDFECPNCGTRAAYSADDLTQFTSAQGGVFSTS